MISENWEQLDLVTSLSTILSQSTTTSQDHATAVKPRRDLDRRTQVASAGCLLSRLSTLIVDQEAEWRTRRADVGARILLRLREADAEEARLVMDRLCAHHLLQSRCRLKQRAIVAMRRTICVPLRPRRRASEREIGARVA